MRKAATKIQAHTRRKKAAKAKNAKKLQSIRRKQATRKIQTGWKNTNQCAICLNRVVKKSEPYCHNNFHDRCIRRWIDSGNHSCPMCRGIRTTNLVEPLTESVNLRETQPVRDIFNQNENENTIESNLINIPNINNNINNNVPYSAYQALLEETIENLLQEDPDLDRDDPGLEEMAEEIASMRLA